MTMPAERPGRVIWRDGEFIPWDDAVVHVNAVGHASVSAAFEGVHAYWSPTRRQLLGFRLRDHMRRLVDLLRLGSLRPSFDADELTAAAAGLLARVGAPGRDVYLRPWGFAAGLHREQMVPAGTRAGIAGHQAQGDEDDRERRRSQPQGPASSSRYESVGVNVSGAGRSASVHSLSQLRSTAREGELGLSATRLPFCWITAAVVGVVWPRASASGESLAIVSWGELSEAAKVRQDDQSRAGPVYCSV